MCATLRATYGRPKCAEFSERERLRQSFRNIQVVSNQHDDGTEQCRNNDVDAAKRKEYQCRQSEQQSRNPRHDFPLVPGNPYDGQRRAIINIAVRARRQEHAVSNT